MSARWPARKCSCGCWDDRHEADDDTFGPCSDCDGCPRFTRAASQPFNTPEDCERN